MTRQRQLELSRRQIPYFDDSVPCTGCEPLVARLDSGAAHPPQVTRYDAHKLPLRMELWFDRAGRFVQCESIGELVCGGERGWLGFWRVIDGSNHHGRVTGCYVCPMRNVVYRLIHERNLRPAVMAFRC